MLKCQNMQDNQGLNRKMKICFAVTKSNWGGAQKYVYTLATSLPKDKYEVSVICGEGNELKNKLTEKGLPVIDLPQLKRDISVIAEIKNFFALIKLLKKESPDILHLNSSKIGGLGSLAGRIAHVPKIIFTAHGWAFNEERGPISEALITFASWLTVILCHKIIVVAEKEKKQILEMPFIAENKIVLIRNGLEKTPTQGRGADQGVGFEFKEREIARKELLNFFENWQKNNIAEIGNSTLWLGTIAELHKNKGLEYAVSALSKVTTPFLFFIIGEGEERKSLENIIKKYSLQEKVFLVGLVENASKLLKAFDIYLCTSIKEGLPYTVLEAGFASLPVVATNVGGIPDIIENGVSGILVTKGRTGEITRALEYLLQNPDKQKLFGENLKAKVEKDFSLEQMLEKTLKLYD